MSLFPFAEYWWFYLAFTGFVLLMLALDLGVFHRKAHEVSFKEATTWSVVWVTLALVFNYLLYRYTLWKFPQDERLMAIPGFVPDAAAWTVSLEFLTGYIVEKSLSVDNIFVFVVVFAYFAIPPKYQHRVLFYGILGALVFRAIFIGMGSWLMQFHWVIYLFGAFLILTGLKMMFGPEKPIDPEKNPVIKLFKRIMPVTAKLHDKNFFVKEHGRWAATPLFIFTSNIFAILGLRAMYFMLAGAVGKFYLLKYGLSIVLVFVGLKMVWLNDLYGGKFPITWSLGFILSTIAVSVIASLMFPRKYEEALDDDPLP